MGKIIFILGGARSGKSAFAIDMAKESRAKRIAYIATCEAKDAEMAKRIALHRRTRPKGWRTFEEPCRVSALAEKEAKRYDVVLIECVTLLVSNLLLNNFNERAIMEEAKKMLAALKKARARAIIVSNEAGLGVVPENRLARDFRDIAGRVNQLIAKSSDEVFFMISGIPRRIK